VQPVIEDLTTNKVAPENFNVPPFGMAKQLMLLQI
jgi:hypothetical protein